MSCVICGNSFPYRIQISCFCCLTGPLISIDQSVTVFRYRIFGLLIAGEHQKYDDRREKYLYASRHI